MLRTQVKTTFWEQSSYYDRIAKVVDQSYPPFQKLKSLSSTKNNILDVGCGDGLKLSNLGSQTSKLVGCEISKAAIVRGKKLHKNIKFVHFDGVSLPFATNEFDLVVSMFVLEHTEKPEELLKEMVRVTTVGGQLCILAPNYGSPNRASPNFVGGRLKKLVTGFLADFKSHGIASWHKVDPKNHSIANFETDDDTTIEPYLGSLVNFFKVNKCKIDLADSVWSMELPGSKLMQKVFRFLGTHNVYPFKFWGPHIFLVATKL